MKRPERVLTEWADDAIIFAGYRAGQEAWTQEEFDRICSVMGQNPAGVPLLYEVVPDLTRAMAAAGWPQDRRDAWYAAFFSPAHMIQFRSIYEVKRALQRKASALRRKVSLLSS